MHKLFEALFQTQTQAQTLLASQLSFIIITPMVIATAVVLWRKGALGLKTMLALSAASLFISWFLYVNLT